MLNWPTFDLAIFLVVHKTSLPGDSLALALLKAARSVAAVREGRSLGDVLGEERRGVAGNAGAQVQDLAYGALRRYGRGEFMLARLLERPLTDGTVHALLLVALYRLETRPDSAYTIVSQAVEAAATLAGGRFKGLVNGVLRNYQRRQEELDRLAHADPVAAHWHPAWWLARLQEAYPSDWQAVIEAGNTQAPMTLRVNRRRCSRDDYLNRLCEAGIAATALGGVAIRLEQPIAVDELPGFAEGWVSVQDAGAQHAADWLALAEGQRILDACAAPGGKAAHILEAADVRLLALEVDASRCRLIDSNFSRLGLGGTVRAADCRQVAQWWDGEAFDRILADVPCSASGVVRRHPDAKWLRRPEDIAQFARVQAQILDALWPTLKPGGRLLYATCSVFPDENGRRIADFLSRHVDARAEPLDGADGPCEAQLLPGPEHDGFFYAALRKAD